MTYRRALLTRWSRRDRLAVVVVATITALLVGSTLIVAAAGTGTSQIAADLNSTDAATVYDDPATALAATPPNATVYPVATVTVDDNATATVLGVPTGTDTNASHVHPPPSPDAVRGPADRVNESVTLSGPDGSARLAVRDPTEGIVPSWWYVATEGTVEHLGPTAAIVISPSASTPTNDPGQTVPLIGALAFFLAGTKQLLGAVQFVTAGAAVLVAVVVFSVTRMAVRDRLTTIAMLRATGLTRRRVLALFGLRAGLLTSVAVLSGGAVGVIVTNAAVNVAVFAGVPTTLSLQVTPAVVATLGPALIGVIVVGVVAGVAASLPTVRRPPGVVDRLARGARATDGGHLPSVLSRFRPRLLSVRAIVPTAATLAVFVAITLVAVAGAGALAPLANPSNTAIVQAGTAHPWASHVDADHASVLRADGVDASPEILVLSIVDGDPFLTRGANFSAYAALSDASLVQGRTPAAPDEAVVGRDLARSLELSIGDTVPLGGSDRRAVMRVTVVGVHRAPGLYDDTLIVPLETGRHLSNNGPGQVNLIRVARSGGPATAEGTVSGKGPERQDAGRVVVRDLAAPDVAGGDGSIATTVTVDNPGATRATRDVQVRLGERSRVRAISLGPGESTTVTVEFPIPPPGEYQLHAGELTRTVRVSDAPPLRFEAVPAAGPSNATLLIRVVNANGNPVENATVTMQADADEEPDAGANDDNQDPVRRSNTDGRLALILPGEGAYRLTATKAGFADATDLITVTRGAERRLAGTLSVTPARPNPVVRPTATVTVSNPWNTTVQRTVAIEAHGSHRRSIELAPGTTRRIEVTLRPAAAGTQAVIARVDGAVLARTTYTVVGDERVVAALAGSGRHAVVDSGLGRAASAALGNVQVLVATLIGIAGMATVATTTAAFARTVHGKRRTIGIHRATGSAPRQVLALVVRDAILIAVPATAFAFVLGYALTWTLASVGVLTAFGVTLSPTVSLPLVAAIAVTTLALSILGAALATVGLLSVPPARLLEGAHGRPGGHGGDRDA